MAYYNPDDFKFDPKKYNLRPEPAGFKIPSLDIPDYSGYKIPSTPPASTPYYEKPTYGDYLGGQVPLGSDRYMPPEPEKPAEPTTRTAITTETAPGAIVPGRTIPGRFLGETTTMRRELEGPAPKYPEYIAPEAFVAPEWDEQEIASLTRKLSSPGVRGLRTGIQQVAGRHYEAPAVRRMTLRAALAGYGQGLESVMAGSRQAAGAEYGQKYARGLEARKLEYESEIRRKEQEYQSQLGSFQAAWDEWVGGAKEITTTQRRYGRPTTTPATRLPSTTTTRKTIEKYT